MVLLDPLDSSEHKWVAFKKKRLQKSLSIKPCSDEQCFFAKDYLSKKLWQSICGHTQKLNEVWFKRTSMSTLMFLNFQTLENFAVIILKLEKRGFTIE